MTADTNSTTWTSTPLGTLVSIQKGKLAQTNESMVNPTDKHYLGATSLDGGPSLFTSSPGVECVESDLLMLWDGERSGLCSSGLKGVIGSTMARLRPNGSVDPRFLTHAVQAKFPFIQGRRTGTGVPHVPKDLDEILVIDYPVEKPEQIQIASVLDAMEDASRRSEVVIAKLEKLRAALIQDLLRFGVNEHGELRSPDPTKLRQSSIGLVPSNWAIEPFTRYGSPDRPVIKTGPFGSTLKGTDWVVEGVPVITIGALGEGEVDPTQLLFVSQEKAKRLSSYVVHEGDLLFSRVADVGRSIVVSGNESGWIMSSNLMWISLDASQVDPHFAWLSLTKSTSVRSQVRRSLNAGGREVANGPILRSLLIAWPSLDEQRQIVALERTMRLKIQAEKAQLAKFKTMKSGLSSDLLTGRIRTSPH